MPNQLIAYLVGTVLCQVTTQAISVATNTPMSIKIALSNKITIKSCII